MNEQTIDSAMAKKLVEASAILGASIIGQEGGWGVMLKLGNTEKPLGAQRTDKPRVWKSLDRCVEYLKNDLKIARFEMLDATNHNDDIQGKSRTDTSERMRLAHEAAAYDKWFRLQIQESLDDSRPSIPNEDVKQLFVAKREMLRKK